MNKKNIVENLFERRSDYKDPDQAETASNLLDTISSDIYSESQRFVFELIQNADDAAIDDQNEVNFSFFDGSLIISHNGHPFSEEDIKSLTSAGSSTKKNDATKTGYKGIGFKSVFGKSERVTIFSDGYQFRFDKKEFDKILPWQIIPIWTELKDLPLEIQETVSQLSYSVSTIIEIENAESLQKDLTDLLSNGQILLFLRKVSKVSVSKNKKLIYSIEKKTISEEDIFNEVTLFKNKSKISSWITKTFDDISVPEETKEELKKDEKTPKKLRDAVFTELSFAAKIEGNKLRALKDGSSLIFTYLPTKVGDFNFPFLVNGSFLTNAAREGIHEDKVWNQWLFSLIGEKIFDWLASLATSKYRFQLLQLLPHKFGSTQNELKQSFDKSFSSHSKSKAYIITEQNQIRKPSEVVLDKTGLSVQSFIDPTSITEFLSTVKKLEFDGDCFVSTQVEESNKLKQVGVEVFELENFETFFCSKSFTTRHNVSDNFDLIRYFKERSENDKKGLWFQTLKTLPFIYDDKELLYNPSNGICFPTGIASTELGEIPIIHPDVFDKIQNHKEIFNWLKKLGVKEPSQVAYVTNVLIPNLHEDNFINSSNFLQITHYLFRLFRENLLDEEMLESLRELKIKTKEKTLTFIEAQNCFLSNKYQPHLKIEGVINGVFYVSEEYLFSDSNELEWNLFFKAIKVKDRVEVETINENNSLSTLRTLTDEGWVSECETEARSKGGFGFGEHNVIRSVKLPSFLNTVPTNIKYAKMFWENIISNPNSLSELSTTANYKYGVGYGHNSYAHSVGNYFAWFLKNKKCIPTTTKEILKSENVFINETEIKQIAGGYLPVFDFENPVSDDWKSAFQFKTKLELKDLLLILTKITEHSETEDEEKKIKVSLKRIGQIYNKLASLLTDMTIESKQVISDWSLQNKLISINGEFESATELKWVTIEGFSTESEKLKIIQIPELCNKNSTSFKELITLFGVQTIEEFIPTFDRPITKRSLKNRLEEILPLYVALLEKINLENGDAEFDRLYHLLNETEFFTTSEIKLSFNYQSETFEGPSLTVYKEEGKFYFKGKWRSERTLLSLIKELSTLLNVFGLNEELRFLLLEADEAEIQEWLIEQGINIRNIKPARRFSRQILTAQENISEDNFTEVEHAAEPNETYSSEEEPSIPEVFKPVNTPNSIDISKVSAKTKSFTNANAKAETNYSKIQSQEVREDVGRWCEEFVYEYLTNQEKNAEIIWVNKDGESNKPYDFEIIENGKKKFIDVKGTPSGSKDLVYLSPNEWVFMFDKGANYSIYRVYNAGNQARIEIIENPGELLQQGKIFPNPITLQV